MAESSDIWLKFKQMAFDRRMLIVASYHDSQLYEKVLEEEPKDYVWLLDSRYKQLMLLWMTCDFDDIQTKLKWNPSKLTS